MSHSVRDGMTSILTAISNAIISASDDEWDTAPCFLHIHVMGTNVRGPISASSVADVDLESVRSPAKLASTNSIILMSSA